MGKTALLAGATGLVGNSLLDKLLRDNDYDKVQVLSRKQLSHHDKMDVIILNNFDKMDEIAEKICADVIFCCLGSTMAKAKSKEAFLKVDYNYPITLADIALKQGAKEFHLVSALGADKNSKVFYNKVKGQVEKELFQKDFKEIHIYRPSLLLGPRQEKRVGEDAAKNLYKILNFAFIGPLRKYKGIHADKVALAMQHFAKTSFPGKHIHENKELLNI